MKRLKKNCILGDRLHYIQVIFLEELKFMQKFWSYAIHEVSLYTVINIHRDMDCFILVILFIPIGFNAVLKIFNNKSSAPDPWLWIKNKADKQLYFFFFFSIHVSQTIVNSYIVRFLDSFDSIISWRRVVSVVWEELFFSDSYKILFRMLFSIIWFSYVATIFPFPGFTTFIFSC